MKGLKINADINRVDRNFVKLTNTSKIHLKT